MSQEILGLLGIANAVLTLSGVAFLYGKLVEKAEGINRIERKINGHVDWHMSHKD